MEVRNDTSSLHAQIAAMEAYIAFLEGSVDGMGKITDPLSAYEVHKRVVERSQRYIKRMNELREGKWEWH